MYFIFFYTSSLRVPALPDQIVKIPQQMATVARPVLVFALSICVGVALIVRRSCGMFACVCAAAWAEFLINIVSVRLSFYFVAACIVCNSRKVVNISCSRTLTHTHSHARLGLWSYVFCKKNCIWQFVRYIEQVFLVAARENRMIYIWNLIWQVKWFIFNFEWQILSITQGALPTSSLFLSPSYSFPFCFCWSWLWAANKWVFLTWAIYF